MKSAYGEEKEEKKEGKCAQKSGCQLRKEEHVDKKKKKNEEENKSKRYFFLS